MGSFCSIICCGCCPSDSKRRQIQKAEQKKNLSILNKLTQNKQRPPLSPLAVKTDEMTDHYKIPTVTLRTEYDVLKHIGYEMGERLDSGGFAVVYTAYHIEKGLRVALKKIRIPDDKDKKSKKKRINLLTDIKNELYVLQTTDHPNVIKMIQHLIIVDRDQMSFYIIMQLAQGGNLSGKLDESGPFSERMCKRWFAQMLSGMSYMHSNGFAHRDLKLSNILLDEAQDILISDFGLSRFVWREEDSDVVLSQTYCGTPPYMAPEVLEMRGFTGDQNKPSGYNAFYADVWSLGVILFKLFTKGYPYSMARGPARAIKQMKARKWRLPPTRQQPSDGLKDLITRMLEFNPVLRITTDQMKTHPWIKQQLDIVEHKNSLRSKNQ